MVNIKLENCTHTFVGVVVVWVNIPETEKSLEEFARYFENIYILSYIRREKNNVAKEVLGQLGVLIIDPLQSLLDRIKLDSRVAIDHIHFANPYLYNTY